MYIYIYALDAHLSSVVGVGCALVIVCLGKRNGMFCMQLCFITAGEYEFLGRYEDAGFLAPLSPMPIPPPPMKRDVRPVHIDIQTGGIRFFATI